jgi:nucleotide sugar dehydrogenase
MDKITIGIIGFGIVGRALHHGFAQTCNFRIYDINPLSCENTFEETIKESDYIFLCLPTPTNMETGKCDYGFIEEALKRVLPGAIGTEKIIIIKSTVVPGTTQYLIDNYPDLHIIYNPEFLTERSYKLDFINSSRIILGGEEQYCNKIADLYYQRFPMTPICITTPTAAEAVKYFSNCMLATKVGICNEFYDICAILKLDYNDIIAMVLMDGRIGKSHIDVPGHDGKRGFAGKCFPKDLKALITKMEEMGYTPEILKSVWDYNYKLRKEDIK